METPHFRHLICNHLDGVLVLAITPPLIRSEELATELAADLHAVLEHYTPTKAVIDLQHVLAINSRAVGSLATFHQKIVRDKHGHVALCGLNPDVRELLAVVRFIDGRGSSPVINPSEEEPQAGKPRAKPLFEIVAKNVQAAVDRLNALAAN